MAEINLATLTQEQLDRLVRQLEDSALEIVTLTAERDSARQQSTVNAPARTQALANAPAQSDEPIAISSGTPSQHDSVGQRSGAANDGAAQSVPGMERNRAAPSTNGPREARHHFDTWLDDLQLYILNDSRESVSLFDHTSGAAPAPPATADSATCSQWLTRDAAARLAIRNHLPLAECAHFGQHKTAQTLYDIVVARYSSPATAALGRLLLPYLFPELSAFATVEDLVSHLRASDARYCAAAPPEFLDRNQPPMFITLYFLVTRLSDSLRSVSDHFLSLDPTSLTVDLLEQHLLAAETSAVDVGAARGTPRTTFFEGCSPSPHAPSYASSAAVDVLSTEDVRAASASGKRRSSKGKGGRGGGGGSSGGSGGSGGGGSGGSGGGSGGVGGSSGGSGGSGSSGSGGSGGRRAGAQRGGTGGGQRQRQQRRSESPSPQQLREWLFQRGASRESLRSGVAIFDLDYDAILSALYALSTSAEGDCYRCVPPDPGIEAAALGANKGGEFSSDLLRDFCCGEGILQSFTLPDSPQQNGIAECRIGLVMEVARTSMIHAAAPHFLWPFAVWYAAHQLNLWPRVSLPETSPTLRWTGEVGNASVFWVWGSRAFVRDTSADKLSARAIPCGPAHSRVSQVDPLPGLAPVEVAAGFGAARGAESGSAEPGGAESEVAGSGAAQLGGEEPRGAEPEGFELGGAELEGAESGDAEPRGATSSGGPTGASPGLSPQQLREWLVHRARLRRGATGAGGAGDTGAGGTRLEELSLVALVLEALDLEELEFEAVAREHVLGVPSSTSLTPPLLCPPPDQSQPPLLSASPLPAPSPYTEQFVGLTERREPVSRPVSPVCTAHRVPRSRPPPVPGTHAMALRPSSVPLRVPLLAPHESSLPEVPDPESDRARAASPTVSRLLATAVTDPSFESAAASALVAELLEFAAACRLDYATALVAESESASPPSVGDACALGMDVLEDRQEDFECLAAAVPHFASMLLAPEGDPDAPDIPTPRSYAEVITGHYSSQWQAVMDAEMASWKSTCTYVNEVPPLGANIVNGMWIFRVKRPLGSPPAFKARYVARGFSQ
ncbi:unnamed protein product [Closterium sp. NIES-54]